MLRKSHSVLVMAAFTVSALLVAALPVSAQQTTGIFQQAVDTANSNAAFLVSGMVEGQAPPPGGGGGGQGFGVGIKGGYLTSTFDAATSTNVFKSNNGWIVGLWFGGNRQGVVGVMGEIMYAKKSAKASVGTTTFDNYYLEIPILARINIGTESRNGISVYGLVGPAFDILLKAKQNDFDIKDNYESLDIGLIIGGGIEITRLLIELQYNKGLRNVAKGSGASFTEIKTHSFAIMAGVRFN